VNLPTLQARRVVSSLPDYGDEPTLSGTFVGTLDELVQFCGQQGVILGMAEIPEQEGDEPRLYRCRWGGGVPASTALKVVADQMEGELLVLRRGPDVYVIGEPSASDMVGRVYHVPDGLATEYVNAMESLASSRASIAAIGDAIVVRDTIAGVRMMDEVFDGIQAARGQWVVEVRFVELSFEASEALGIDWELTGTLALDAMTNGGLTVTDVLSARLNGIVLADAAEEHVKLLTSVRLHCIEGHAAEFQVGDTVPVPVGRTISDQGTVTQDFEDVDTGVLLAVEVRTEPDGRLRVGVTPELSEITGFVQDRPIRSRRRLQTSAVVEPGGTLIAGGFYQLRGRARKSGLPQLLQTPGLALHESEDDQRRVFVLVRVIDPLQPAVAQVPDHAEEWQRMAVQRGTGFFDESGFHWVDE